ncbi:MAG: hypothetical protein IKK77_02335 [Clostridia bacterium]|nr:hypothetical protein [Clostridia bacterium]
MKKRMYQSPEMDFKFFLTNDILLASEGDFDIEFPEDGELGDDDDI